MGEWFFQTIFLPPTFSFLAHTRNCRFIWEGGKCPPCSSVLLPATWGKVGRWSPGCRRTEPTSTLVLLLLLLLLLFETFSFQLSALLTDSRTCWRWWQYPASLKWFFEYFAPSLSFQCFPNLLKNISFFFSISTDLQQNGPALNTQVINTSNTRMVNTHWLLGWSILRSAKVKVSIWRSLSVLASTSFSLLFRQNLLHWVSQKAESLPRPGAEDFTAWSRQRRQDDNPQDSRQRRHQHDHPHTRIQHQVRPDGGVQAQCLGHWWPAQDQVGHGSIWAGTTQEWGRTGGTILTTRTSSSMSSTPPTPSALTRRSRSCRWSLSLIPVHLPPSAGAAVRREAEGGANPGVRQQAGPDRVGHLGPGGRRNGASHYQGAVFSDAWCLWSAALSWAGVIISDNLIIVDVICSF